MPRIHSWHDGELSTETSLTLPISPLTSVIFKLLICSCGTRVNFLVGAITTCSLNTGNETVLMFAATLFSWKGERKVPCSS